MIRGCCLRSRRAGDRRERSRAPCRRDRSRWRDRSRRRHRRRHRRSERARRRIGRVGDIRRISDEAKDASISWRRRLQRSFRGARRRNRWLRRRRLRGRRWPDGGLVRRPTETRGRDRIDSSNIPHETRSDRFFVRRSRRQRVHAMTETSNKGGRRRLVSLAKTPRATQSIVSGVSTSCAFARLIAACRKYEKRRIDLTENSRLQPLLPTRWYLLKVYNKEMVPFNGIFRILKAPLVTAQKKNVIQRLGAIRRHIDRGEDWANEGARCMCRKRKRNQRRRGRRRRRRRRRRRGRRRGRPRRRWRWRSRRQRRGRGRIRGH